MDNVKPLIMVVDDHPDALEALRLMLEEDGYKVITAVNGQHALERLEAALSRRHQQGYPAGIRFLPDLIVSDIMMPLMDGYEFYEQTRTNPYLNHIPFIFLTAKQDEADIRRGKELGVDDYLIKPVKMADLLASVRGKLRRVSQQRALAAQVVGDTEKPSAVGVILVISFLVFVVLITVIITVIWVS